MNSNGSGGSNSGHRDKKNLNRGAVSDVKHNSYVACPKSFKYRSNDDYSTTFT
jgi:hypothetical protein